MAFSLPNYGTASFSAQAQPDAVDFDILAAADNNTGVVSGCAVTAQGTPDMTLAVAVGVVRVAGTEAAVSAGNVTITAAHATLNRFDLVVANNSGTKSVTAGTAAAEPVFPATPANSAVLAAVYVPAADTAIGSTQIIDKRVLLPKAAVFSKAYCTSALTLSTTTTDIAGASVTVTLDRANQPVTVEATFDFDITTVGATALGLLDVDGAEQTEQALFNAATAAARGSVNQGWQLMTLAAGSRTLKLRGKKSAAGGAMTAQSVHTGLRVIVWP